MTGYHGDTDPIPAEDWEQQGPTGGAYDGESPAVALNVVTVGIGTVREVPTLASNSGTVSASGGVAGVAQLVSASPQRRRITIGALSGTPRLCSSKAQAEAAEGLPLPTGVAPTCLQYAGELWVRFMTGTDGVGFFAEIDQD